MTPTDTAQSPKERARHASALVDAAKAGDQRAFAELVQTYRPRIYALALHLTGQHDDAEDITQDAFLKAYTKLDQFEGRSQFFTWLSHKETTVVLDTTEGTVAWRVHEAR